MYSQKYNKYINKIFGLKQSGGNREMDSVSGRPIKLTNNHNFLTKNEDEHIRFLPHMNNSVPTQTLLINKVEGEDNSYMIKDVENNCITAENELAENAFRPCTGLESQKYIVKEHQGNYKFIISPKNNSELCMSNLVNEMGLLKNLPCYYPDLQAMTISENFKNNDNEHNHIKPFLQNLILSYIPREMDITDWVSMLMSPEDIPFRIANSASEMHGNLLDTQSAIWCPLIYNALKLSWIPVPLNWCLYDSIDGAKQETFNLLSQQLSQVKGWNIYAKYILLNYDGPELENDFNEEVFAKAIEIRDSLLSQGILF